MRSVDEINDLMADIQFTNLDAEYKSGVVRTLLWMTGRGFSPLDKPKWYVGESHGEKMDSVGG